MIPLPSGCKRVSRLTEPEKEISAEDFVLLPDQKEWKKAGAWGSHKLKELPPDWLVAVIAARGDMAVVSVDD